MDKKYLEQVTRMLQILPLVMREKVFVLKGGTAINFFIRDVPRLSVDIDLAYTPLEDRKTSFTEMSNVLLRIKQKVLNTTRDCTITEKRISGGYTVKLFVRFKTAVVIVEPNTVLRGTMYPPQELKISSELKGRTGIDTYMSVPVISKAELYGGKIIAALDRQHPRDLFDVKMLLEHEGITTEIRRAFVVYLAGHDRPIHEVLSPKLHDMQAVFTSEFEGLTTEPVQYKVLEKARTDLIQLIHSSLNDAERRFLLSIKQGEPQWNLIDIKGIDRLPSIQWKLTNIRKMDKTKHDIQVNKLKAVLQL